MSFRRSQVVLGVRVLSEFLRLRLSQRKPFPPERSGSILWGAFIRSGVV